MYVWGGRFPTHTERKNKIDADFKASLVTEKFR